MLMTSPLSFLYCVLTNYCSHNYFNYGLLTFILELQVIYTLPLQFWNNLNLLSTYFYYLAAYIFLKVFVVLGFHDLSVLLPISPKRMSMAPGGPRRKWVSWTASHWVCRAAPVWCSHPSSPLEKITGQEGPSMYWAVLFQEEVTRYSETTLSFCSISILRIFSSAKVCWNFPLDSYAPTQEFPWKIAQTNTSMAGWY